MRAYVQRGPVSCLFCSPQAYREDSRRDSYVTGAASNTLESECASTTREAFAVHSRITYDDGFSGRNRLNGKVGCFDLAKIRGELAESYDVSPDAMKSRLVICARARFQGCTPSHR